MFNWNLCGIEALMDGDDDNFEDECMEDDAELYVWVCKVSYMISQFCELQLDNILTLLALSEGWGWGWGRWNCIGSDLVG